MTDEEHPGWLPTSDGRRRCPPATAADRRTVEQPVLALAPWTDPPNPPRHTDPSLPPTRAIAALPARHLPHGGAPGTPGSSRSSRRSRQGDGFVALPGGLRIAVVALAAVIVLATAGVFVTAAGQDRDLEAPPSEELGAAADPTGADPPLSSATTSSPVPPGAAAGSEPTVAPGPSATSTIPPAPTSTADPGPTSTVPAGTPGDPLAACSTGQRNAIERGNHPWSWYIERFDEDGDGVLCT